MSVAILKESKRVVNGVTTIKIEVITINIAIIAFKYCSRFTQYYIPSIELTSIQEPDNKITRFMCRNER